MELEELTGIIKGVQAEYPELTQFGFGGKGEIRPEAVDLCVQWLLHFDGLERRKTVNEKLGSYTLKHIVERHYDTYIANGEFICAALYLGYKMKIRKPNAWFNIKTVRSQR